MACQTSDISEAIQDHVVTIKCTSLPRMHGKAQERSDELVQSPRAIQLTHRS